MRLQRGGWGSSCGFSPLLFVEEARLLNSEAGGGGKGREQGASCEVRERFAVSRPLRVLTDTGPTRRMLRKRRVVVDSSRTRGDEAAQCESITRERCELPPPVC